MINYNKLSSIQAELDNHIGLEKQLKTSDYTLEKTVALSVELGELLNETPSLFKYWSIKPNQREKALTEFIDGLHFLLSLANDYKIENYEYTKPYDCDIRKLVLGIFNMISHLPATKNIKGLLDHYLLLGEKLNFTAEDIESAYLDKNNINHARAESGVY